MSKPTSAKQLAANRRNAQRSTGPRTALGRERSKHNATKHGILSTQVVVAGSAYHESSSELQALHRRFWEHHEPVGPLEEMLLDQIVTAHWRLRRVLTAESGAITLSVSGALGRSRQDASPAQRLREWLVLPDPLHAMKKSSLGNSILIDILQEARAAVAQSGKLTETEVRRVSDRLGGRSNSLTHALDTLRQRQAAEPAAPDTAQRHKTEALAFLDHELHLLRSVQRRIFEEELAEHEARNAAAILPPIEVLSKIMRYETQLEHQLYRAMLQLERVQRMRLGESLPAPLSVEVGLDSSE